MAEVEDHLREAAGRLVADGLEHAEAKRSAILRFGPAPLVARALATREKGVVMPTQFTRRAGLAAIAAVVLFVAGAFSFILTRASGLSDESASASRAYTFVPLMLATIALFVVFLVGLRHRHAGRMGRLGTGSYALIAASPVLAFPFSWLAPAALVVILAVGFGVLSVALFRASVMPRRAVVMFGLGLPLGLLIVLIVLADIIADAVGYQIDLSNFVPFGMALSGVGLVWIGWTMWLEPAPMQRLTPGGGLAA